MLRRLPTFAAAVSLVLCGGYRGEALGVARTAGRSGITVPGGYSMSDTPPVIGYAPDDLNPPADGLLRRVVAWSAIVYGGQAVVGTALHVALAKGWVASPASMSWGLGGGGDGVVMAAQTLAMCVLMAGGVLLLRRSPAGVIVLRASVACSVVLTALGLAVLVHANPVYASYWSTPAAAAVNARQFLAGLWPPVLIALLTLPPLARRMR